MPFRLRSAPAAFQRAADSILSCNKWQIALVYLDEDIFYSKTRDETLRTCVHCTRATSKFLGSFESVEVFFDRTVSYMRQKIQPEKQEVSNR